MKTYSETRAISNTKRTSKNQYKIKMMIISKIQKKNTSNLKNTNNRENENILRNEDDQKMRTTSEGDLKPNAKINTTTKM